MRFLVVLFFVFIFSFVVLAPAGVFAFSGSGSGTSGSPYLVTSCSQLEEVANNLTAYYQQTADIDCTGTTYIPIGSSGSQFTGTYDGNGFKIEHVTIDSILGYVGLFGVVGNGGVVTKVGLVSGSVTVNDDDQEPETGGIVGENHGTISKSYSLVDITNAPRRSYVGGIVGLNYGTVSDAYATGDVTETGIESEVGGVVGDSTSGQVMRVYSTGSVTGGDENGGLVGEGVTLSDSFSTAIVDTSGSDVGGLVGYSASISNSYWNKVSGSPAHCYSSGDTGCTAIANNLAYFYTTSNAPMDTWNFTTIWSTQNNGTGFPIFIWQETPAPSSHSSDSSSSGSSVSSSCTEAMPTSAPKLFHLSAQGLTSTLFFVPVTGQNTSYVISYGPTPSADLFATSFNYSDTSGVIPYSINYLFPGKWYFKVRGQNGCMPGEWSSIKSIKVL